jgi:hypothetical protein
MVILINFLKLKGFSFKIRKIAKLGLFVLKLKIYLKTKIVK